MTGTSVRPVGEWLGASFERLRENCLTLCGLFVFGVFIIGACVVSVYALGVTALGIAQGWDTLMRNLLDPTRLAYMMEESGPAVALFNVFACLVGLRLYAWILKAAVHASIDPSIGFRGALRQGSDRIYPFMGLLVVHQVLVNVGVILLVLPGILMAVWFGFALWACARDRSGVFGALGDSARAVKGHFLGVFGRMLLAGLIGGAMMIVPILGWLVGGAFMMTAWGCLYEDLRPRPKPATALPRRPVGRAAA